MKDNRETREAEAIRAKSEFLKRVHDFARYMQKEYIDGDEDRSLLISAGEHFSGNNMDGGMTHIVLGDRMLNTAGISSMMQQENLKEMFRTARIVSINDDSVGEAIRYKRRCLRRLYVTASVAAVWSMFLVALAIAGVGTVITTISNLLLMACTCLILWREITPLRRQLRRLRIEEHDERTARIKHGLEAMSSFLETMRRRLMQDDDEDDE